MADDTQQPTGTEPECLYAFGGKILKSQLARIPLDLEPPLGSTVDVWDDDHARWSFFRKPKLTGWLEIEGRSKRLTQEVDEEYIARQRERPAADVATEAERSARLRFGAREK